MTQAEYIQGLFTRDGLENLMANLGTAGDKRSYSRFTGGTKLSGTGGHISEEANNLYRTSWVAGKVVDIIPNDMTREWRRFVNDDPDIVTALEKEEKRIGLNHAFNTAHKWGRLYGTAAIVMAVDDGQEAHMPLNYKTVRPGSLRHIKVLDRSMLFQDLSTALTLDPLDENFGMPEHYTLSHNANIKIHHSRILRFDGVKLPHYELQRNGYMNDSVLDRIYDPIVDLTTATTGASSMIYNMNVDVFSVEGLLNLLQSPNGEELIMKRFALMGLMKSMNNIVVKDTRETFETRTHTFTGLPDLIDRFSSMIAAATDIPATRLLGTSPGGLNATGESDLRNYYDNLRSRQVNEYNPLLERIDKLMAANLGITDEAELESEWSPLWHPTATEQADIENKRADRDSKYLNEGIVDELTVVRELANNKTYSAMTPELLEENNNDPIEPDETSVNKEPEAPAGDTGEPSDSGKVPEAD